MNSIQIALTAICIIYFTVLNAAFFKKRNENYRNRYFEETENTFTYWFLQNVIGAVLLLIGVCFTITLMQIIFKVQF